MKYLFFWTVLYYTLLPIYAQNTKITKPIATAAIHHLKLEPHRISIGDAVGNAEGIVRGTLSNAVRHDIAKGCNGIYYGYVRIGCCNPEVCFNLFRGCSASISNP